MNNGITKEVLYECPNCGGANCFECDNGVVTKKECIRICKGLGLDFKESYE